MLHSPVEAVIPSPPSVRSTTYATSAAFTANPRICAVSGVTRVNGSEAQRGERAVVEEQRAGVSGQTRRVQILTCEHPSGAEPVDQQVDLACQVRPAQIDGRVDDERHGQDGRTVDAGSRSSVCVNTERSYWAVSGRFLKVGVADGAVFGAGEDGRESDVHRRGEINDAPDERTALAEVTEAAGWRRRERRSRRHLPARTGPGASDLAGRRRDQRGSRFQDDILEQYSRDLATVKGWLTTVRAQGRITIVAATRA